MLNTKLENFKKNIGSFLYDLRAKTHFFFLFFKFIYFGGERVRVQEHEKERGRERKGEKIPSRLHAQQLSTEPDTGLDPTTARS